MLEGSESSKVNQALQLRLEELTCIEARLRQDLENVHTPCSLYLIVEVSSPSKFTSARFNQSLGKGTREIFEA